MFYYDKDFLLKLDKRKNKIVYARITALTFDERPIETVEGRATGGSINVDGVSAIRRTCSLTMVAKDFDYMNYYWGVNTKFKLEVGLANDFDSRYPEIIWFNQGIYIFTSFNTSRTTNNFTISLSGKDKMCLLNGEVGGALESSVDFGAIEEENEDGVWEIRKIPVREIIRNAVHVYAREPYHNIVINDLEDFGLELLEYRYDIPMYLYRRAESVADDGTIIPASYIFDNVLLNGSKKCLVEEDGVWVETTLDKLSADHLDMLVDTLVGTKNPSIVKIDETDVYVAKVEYGQTAGYRLTDLIYPGDLIANIGESVVSVLDKIKNMLAEFEYFYDVDGRFIFQKKKSFINTIWTPTMSADNEEGGTDYYVDAFVNSSSWSYTFNEGELITAFNNAPNLLNMRNDFSIWGVRKGITGADIPVHMRYAIDSKPVYYKTFDDVVYISDESLLEDGYILTDWREIIFQMAKDYYKHNLEDDFELQIRDRNIDYYPTGMTGYERYYIDIEGFWRQLYNPNFAVEEIEYQEKIDNKAAEIADIERKMAETTDKAELKILQQELETANNVKSNLEYDLSQFILEKENYYEEGHKHEFWHKNVYEHPETLNFWFDFLDMEGELSQFNVRAVGPRSKAVNETIIKSIYFRETPEVIFIKSNEEKEETTGYKYIQMQDDSMFSISAQGKSAKDRLDELIYQHGYCIESATITAIPVYYLQPNTRIHITDNETNINGDYIISKITIPLTYNGMMSITATKAAENII